MKVVSLRSTLAPMHIYPRHQSPHEQTSKHLTWIVLSQYLVLTFKMATFTKISEDETPSITVHPTHKISKINNNIYGGFTEYVPRFERYCIYHAYRLPGTWAGAYTAASTTLEIPCRTRTVFAKMLLKPSKKPMFLSSGTQEEISSQRTTGKMALGPGRAGQNGRSNQSTPVITGPEICSHLTGPAGQS